MPLHTLRHTHRTWLAWTAALLVLLGALAPTVSRWLHAGPSLPLALMEVCTTREGGPSLIVYRAPDTMGRHATPDSEVPAHPAHAAHLDHCPFCLLQGEGHGLPPPTGMAVLAPAAPGTELPPLFLSAPRTLPAWAPSLARAPPALFA